MKKKTNLTKRNAEVQSEMAIGNRVRQPSNFRFYKQKFNGYLTSLLYLEERIFKMAFIPILFTLISTNSHFNFRILLSLLF